MPIDREGDGSIAQHTKVKGVVRVFPDVIAAHHGSFAEGLLEARMELVAVSRLQRSGHPRRAEKQRRQHLVCASLAGQYEIFIERRFQGARIGNAKNGIGLLDAVGSAKTRLRLTGYCQAVIQIAADAQIEKPVASLDLVLDIQR